MQRDPSRLILCQRVRGSVRAVRAVRNTRVFQTETGVVADVAWGESGLPGPVRIAHWLTASSKFTLLLPIVWRPMSYCPVLVGVPRPFLQISGSSWPLPTRASMTPAVARTSSDRNPEARIVVFGGP